MLLLSHLQTEPGLHGQCTYAAEVCSHLISSSSTAQH